MPSDSEFVDLIICPRCYAELPAGDEVCGRCGAHTASSVVHASLADRPRSAAANSKSRDSMVDNRWFVLGILFGVTMFLGLPLLWKSKAFDRQGKVFVTILVFLYSILIFWVFFLVMQWCYESIRQSL